MQSFCASPVQSSSFIPFRTASRDEPDKQIQH
jgi:hypothetical protein